MQKRLRLPIGVEFFKEIRTNCYYYVDKTRLIEELLESRSEVYQFTRPRRFGKTLNMSMLRSFFEIGADKSLFDGLYISSRNDLCDKYMGKFPVIFITLKGAEGRNYEEAAYCLIELIRSEVMRFSFLKNDDKLNDEENILRA